MLNEFGGVIFVDEQSNRAPEEWELLRPVTLRGMVAWLPEYAWGRGYDVLETIRVSMAGRRWIPPRDAG